jgi:hypothetical protein
MPKIMESDPIQTRFLQHIIVILPEVGRVQRGSYLRREDQVMFFPTVSRNLTQHLYTLLLLPEDIQHPFPHLDGTYG